MIVDRYEVDEAYRLNLGPQVLFTRAIDLEIPVYAVNSPQNIVSVISSDQRNKIVNTETVSIDLPVHLRYQSPSVRLEHAEIRLSAPQVYFVENHEYQEIRAQPMNNQINSTTIILTAPAGQLETASLVRWSTLGATLFGTVYVHTYIYSERIILFVLYFILLNNYIL